MEIGKNVPPNSNVATKDVPAEYNEVLNILGKNGDYKDNVFKVNLPRADLQVRVAGVTTPTAFGFGGWLAMTKSMGADMMMGDLVLLQDEVNPVMSALLDNGLEITAIHNHFFWEEPRIFYMHVHSHGLPASLAHKFKPALDIFNHPALPNPTKAPLNIDVVKLTNIIGHKPDVTEPVIKFTIGRDDFQLMDMSAAANTRMGLNTWAAFTGTGQKAAIAGDVAMLNDEVNPTLKALRQHGLNVVALHNHMLMTDPFVFFLHYWGVGPTEELATGFKAVLDQLGKR